MSRNANKDVDYNRAAYDEDEDDEYEMLLEITIAIQNDLDVIYQTEGDHKQLRAYRALVRYKEAEEEDELYRDESLNVRYCIYLRDFKRFDD